MKPRTKMEKEVDALRNKLTYIQLHHEAYAIKNIFPRSGYYSRKKAWCHECGTVFPYVGKDKVVCPHCGKRIVLKEYGGWTSVAKMYYGIMTVVKNYQVIKVFVAERKTKRKNEPVYSFNECYQLWFDKSGNVVPVAKYRMPFGYYSDLWCFDSEMTIRKKISERCYRFCGYLYPKSGVAKWLRKKGFNNEIYDKTKLSYNEIIRALLSNNVYESVAKMKQWSLFDYYVRYDCQKHWSSAIVCNRHGYYIEDATLWCDHLDLLDYFHKDTHNPKYICPQNLGTEHDRLVDKKKAVETEMYEAKYKESKSKYFGIEFGNKDIIVSVIKSVKEMAKEGTAMHHCVFTNGYYMKDESLILSAKDIYGNRLETAEISLRTFNLIQCRGRFNKPSKYHNQIVDLINHNINKIKKVRV